MRDVVLSVFLETTPISAMDLLRLSMDRLGLDPYSRRDIHAVQAEIRHLLDSGQAELGRHLWLCPSQQPVSPG